jgi:ABC-type Fe3+-hydroxamate transport system substrate-binding protein
MPFYRDQLNREIHLVAIPKRIISVVPSQTELLFYLGLNEEVVGITKFCIHPADKFKSTEKIGGTKQLDIAKIKSLKPDLVIANKEENERSQIEELINFCPVWISDIADLPDALDMIERVGEVVGKSREASALKMQIARQFDSLIVKPSTLKVAYFIWRNPYMAAGSGTFIDAMLQKCGLINAVEIERYPEINEKTLLQLQPDIILLSSEPYPFKEKHLAEFRALLPKAKVKLVDGELFSWYGSRLLEAPKYFEKLLVNLKSV